jgi:hypothetical protein
MTTSDGERIICKHKGDKFCETATPRQVVDPGKQTVLDQAEAIAREWVTMERLKHVLDKLPQGINMEGCREVIQAMQEDVKREAAGEIVWSKDAAAAISKATVVTFKRHLQNQIKG